MSLFGTLRCKAACRASSKLPSSPQFSSAKLIAGILSEESLVLSWVLARHPWFGKTFGIQRHYKSAPLQERKMMDRRRMHVKGGHGGEGCTSFRRSRHDRYGEADGGRGGKGGDVIFKCSEEFWDFSHLQHHFNAKNGGNGSSKRRVGSRGDDKIVPVPMGTVIYIISGEIPLLQESSRETTQDNQESDENGPYVLHGSNEQNDSRCVDEEEPSEMAQKEVEDDDNSALSGTEMEDASSGIEDSDVDESEQVSAAGKDMPRRAVAELLKAGESLLVASGGEGGRGNAAMARGRGSKKRLPSREHEQGYPGTEAFLVLELKTIADIGFVGAPNAGKSTLLGAISRAKPKVGHYAFTTLRPNLGKLQFEDFFSITVADIPGLIKGAHMNVGLGHDFLRHIERTKVLAYVVDLAASVGNNKGSPPWVQYEDLKFELEMYQSGLSNRPSLIVATKLDENGAVEMLQEMQNRLPSMQILPVCAPLEQGIHDLRLALREAVSAAKQTTVYADGEAVSAAMAK